MNHLRFTNWEITGTNLRRWAGPLPVCCEIRACQLLLAPGPRALRCSGVPALWIWVGPTHGRCWWKSRGGRWEKPGYFSLSLSLCLDSILSILALAVSPSQSWMQTAQPSMVQLLPQHPVLPLPLRCSCLPALTIAVWPHQLVSQH